MSGIAEGLVHPIFGIDHALAILAVGMIAGLIGGRAQWLVCGAFLAAMALGGAWGLRRMDLPNFETAIALSVVAVGVCLAIGRMLPLSAVTTAAALLAFPHGYAHGTEAPLDASVGGYFVGFLLAAAILLMIGMGIELGLRRVGEPTASHARQVLGGVTAVIGFAFLLGWM